MPVHVALLRGINVGGHHKIAMADLRQLFVGLGFADVSSYIQSGNVVFTSEVTDAAKLAADIEGQILAMFGFAAPVVLRTARQLGAVAAANPFVAGGAEAGVSVGFLAATPDPERVRSLGADPLADPTAAGGDEFSVSGQEVYLHHPNGYGRTKLTNSYFDRRLGTTMTVRNWRTVMTLLEMSDGPAAG